MFNKIAEQLTKPTSTVSASGMRSPKAEAAAKVSLESGFHQQIRSLASEYDALAVRKTTKQKELEFLRKTESETTDVENSLMIIDKELEIVLKRKKELEDETLKVFLFGVIGI